MRGETDDEGDLLRTARALLLADRCPDGPANAGRGRALVKRSINGSGDATRGEPAATADRRYAADVSPAAGPAFSHLLERLLCAFTSVEQVELDACGRIVAANPAFARHLGMPASELNGRSAQEFLSAGNADMVLGWAKGTAAPLAPHLLNFVTTSGETYTLRCIVERRADRLHVFGEAADASTDGATEELLRVNNEFATLARELASKSRELERTSARLAATLQDLETSYWHLRKIHEVMPICMGCGQVKTDGSRWESVVEYLRSNEIFLSHGYCPPCAETLTREFGLEDDDTHHPAG